MTSTDKQQWIQNACINHNLLYISTQYTLIHWWDYTHHLNSVHRQTLYMRQTQVTQTRFRKAWLHNRYTRGAEGLWWMQCTHSAVFHFRMWRSGCLIHNGSYLTLSDTNQNAIPTSTIHITQSFLKVVVRWREVIKCESAKAWKRESEHV